MVIDSDQSITKKAWVKNHYGVSEITGPDLVETGLNQVKSVGGEVVKDKVSNLSGEKGNVKIETENGSYEANHVILATGMIVELAEASGINTKDGTEPRVKKVVKVDEQGKTNVSGIWAAGTCAGQSVHTIITAGHGASVAINVISEINGERYVDHDILK
ncbi:FAD-dependent oxidoreductase [Salipaludibacillus neizhouensis]|uniref:FAD-dependent oxidoreductase n=1 Tax=Salipaludibacillus neizhouensis TaxID=885475 RepID=UPI0026BDC863